METFFLIVEVILVGLGLFGLMMLTNLWWTMIAGSILGIVAMEKALAVHNEARLKRRIREVAKRHLPGGRAA